ncbi:hypothetical protein EV421DRAFT_193897 [Armillaria borealis]|uniref:Uncharacterized protein n=1 Tax=Armillaria borealis TaxID=47425 RepID=A0AA39JSV3_9AGAR|nr:hypothetical protein EV421DRAFT_193897 [Armillaria borealis]
MKKLCGESKMRTSIDRIAEERVAAGVPNSYSDRRTAAVMDAARQAAGVPPPAANRASSQTNNQEKKRRQQQGEIRIRSEQIAQRNEKKRQKQLQEMMRRQRQAEMNAQNERRRVAENNAATFIPHPLALPPSSLTMRKAMSVPPPMPVLSTSSQTFNASSSSQPPSQPITQPTARFPVSSTAQNTATLYQQLPQLPPMPQPSSYPPLSTTQGVSLSALPAGPSRTSDIAADFSRLNMNDEPQMMPLGSPTRYEGDSMDSAAPQQSSSHRRARQKHRPSNDNNRTPTRAAPSRYVFQHLFPFS